MKTEPRFVSVQVILKIETLVGENVEIISVDMFAHCGGEDTKTVKLAGANPLAVTLFDAKQFHICDPSERLRLNTVLFDFPVILVVWFKENVPVEFMYKETLTKLYVPSAESCVEQNNQYN